MLADTSRTRRMGHTCSNGTGVSSASVLVCELVSELVSAEDMGIASTELYSCPIVGINRAFNLNLRNLLAGAGELRMRSLPQRLKPQVCCGPSAAINCCSAQKRRACALEQLTCGIFWLGGGLRTHSLPQRLKPHFCYS